MGYTKKTVVVVAASFLILGSLSGCVPRTAHQQLKWKAEDFFTDKGVIALCKAIEKKNVAEVDRLVKSGVNINAKGRNNMTPLLWAFPMGEEIFKKALELGADPNVELTGDVWHAPLLVQGHSVMSACASPDIVEGLTHREYFPGVPMDNYLKFVLQHGGNPNITDVNGKTPLFYLGLSIPRKVRERVRLLVEAGGDLNHRDSQGCTPLNACIGRETDYLLCMLDAGADYRIPDNGGSDVILRLEKLRKPQGPGGQANSFLDRAVADARPVFEWLSNEGVNWKAAHAALDSPEAMRNLKSLPADYKHRPWLPQRPTLKKPDAKSKAKK